MNVQCRVIVNVKQQQTAYMTREFSDSIVYVQ